MMKHNFSYYQTGSKISTECFGQVIHLLTSLSGGRLALIFYQNQIVSPSTVDVLQVCTKALLGDPIAAPGGIRHQLDITTEKTIRTVIRALRPYWSTFQFDVELPDANVLIPPWINDSKILNSNPELQQL